MANINTQAIYNTLVTKLDINGDKKIQYSEFKKSIDAASGVNSSLEMGEFQDWLKENTGCSQAETALVLTNYFQFSENAIVSKFRKIDVKKLISGFFNGTPNENDIVNKDKALTTLNTFFENRYCSVILFGK